MTIAQRPIASIAQVDGLQGALDAKRLIKHGVGSAAGLKAALDAGLSTSISVLGDSTGNGTDEWVYLLGGLLAAEYPAHTVRHRLYNASSVDYDAPTVIQAGASGDRYVTLTGATSYFLSYPHDATNAITGDIDVRIRMAFAEWPLPADRSLVSKFGVAGNRSWRFYATGSELLRFQWTVDGSTLLQVSSSSALSLTVDVPVWLRCTFAVATGQAHFYTSTDGASWTELGAAPAAAGATSIFGGTTQMEVGTRGTGGDLLRGRVYEVDVRSGIGGTSVVPRMVEYWSDPTDAVYSGAPVIDIINGSISGASLADLTAIASALTPDFGQSLVFVSTGHNEGGNVSSTYFSALDSLLSAIRGRLPLAAVCVVAQNPRTTPAVHVNSHAVRCARASQWAIRNGCGYLPVFREFSESDTPIADLVNPADGVHPLPDGSALWAATALDLIKQRA